MAKYNLHLHVFISKDQREKLKLKAYYTGKSIGKIIREYIDSDKDNKEVKK